MPTAMPPAEIHRLHVEIGQQEGGRARHAHLGVAHRRRRVGVERAEIALPVQQRQAHREILRHAHQRVVDRLVAMGVVFTDHVADDAGGFAVGLVVGEAVLVHREQDAAVHGLQPVAQVGNGAADDHAHGVVEIAAAHLVLDRHGRAGVEHARPGRRGPVGDVVVVAGQGRLLPGGAAALSASP